MGDFSKILKIKNIFFNENFEIRSPMENIPSDSSVDYFPNEWLYKETIQKKIQNNPEYKSIIPFLLKFSIDNFISFIPYNEFIQCNNFLKFKKVIEQENFCISKWKNNFLFHGFSFNKNQSAKIVIKSVIDDYFFKEKLNKIFLIEGAEIKGIIYFDDSSYLSIYEDNLLICEPDFIIDGKIIDFKVCEKNKDLEWARQLFIYSEGLVQNKIIPHGMYVLNLFTNELIKFEID